MREPRDGRDGPQGPQGVPGPQGAEGIQGKQGVTGLQGPAGLDGKDGLPGERGPEGKQGERGLPGQSGKAGIAGVQGDTGPQGPTGARGPQGPEGPEGPAGPAPAHVWDGTSLAFYNPDGSIGRFVDLQGPKGKDGTGGLGTTNGIYGGGQIDLGIEEAPMDGQKYIRQLGTWVVAGSAGGGVDWGSIGGTLSDQGDLNTVLVSKASQSSLDSLSSSFTALVSSLATVATSGAYSDLSGTPTLGTAASHNASDFATAAQGTEADSAVQPGDLATVATTGAYADLSGTPTIPTLVPPISFAYGDATPTAIFTFASNGTVTDVGLTIDTAFDGASPSVEIGITGTADALLPADANDVTQVCSYDATPDLHVTAGQQIILTIVPGSGASTGAGRIFVQFLPD